MTWWEFKAWNSALKYYFPNEKLIFKYPLDAQSRIFLPSLGAPYFHNTRWADKPEKDDLVLHKKEFQSPTVLSRKLMSEILYENKFFIIYEAKEKSHTSY